MDADGKTTSEYDDRLDLQHESAGERYREYVRRLGLTNIIYGLMRRDAMENTNLMGNGKLPAADVSFIEAMVLLGKFVEVPGVLFHRRMHKLAFSANPEPEKMRQFWKASTSPVKCQRWRAHLAGIGAIMRSPLPAVVKLELLAFQGKRMFWDRTQLAHDLVALFAPRARP